MKATKVLSKPFRSENNMKVLSKTEKYPTYTQRERTSSKTDVDVCQLCTQSLHLGDVAAVVRSSTISPLNNRRNKRNKERGVKTIELLHIAVQ